MTERTVRRLRGAGLVVSALAATTLAAACMGVPHYAAPLAAPVAPAEVATGPAAVAPVVDAPATAHDSTPAAPPGATMSGATTPAAASAPPSPAPPLAVSGDVEDPVAIDSTFDPTDGSGKIRWLGRDAAHALSADDRTLLRDVFGIDDVRRLYVPTASGDVLRYAAHAPGCSDELRVGALRGACRAVSVRVGLDAPRAPDETWDAYTARVTRGGTHAWSSTGRVFYTNLAALGPDARPAFERLLADAREAGFPVHVRETYRTPERQAAILARNDGRTTTATSAHSFGRAVDVSIGDGRIGRRSTHRTWVAFRRWVLGQQNGAFRLIGTPESTWDWPHIEYVGPLGTPMPVLGYRSLDALVAAARACHTETSTLADAEARCTIASPRPGAGVAVSGVMDDEPVARGRSRRRRRGAGRSTGTRSRRKASRSERAKRPKH